MVVVVVVVENDGWEALYTPGDGGKGKEGETGREGREEGRYSDVAFGLVLGNGVHFWRRP